MNVLEKVIGLIAIQTCANCGSEGSTLCSNCEGSIEPLPRICYRCGALDHRGVCPKCKPAVKLNGVFMSCLYDGSAQKLVRSLKYGHSRTAVLPMAYVMHKRLPKLEGEWLVTAVPTATRRVRERSFDHSKLLARKFADLSGYKFADSISRLGQSRQVGAKRIDRLNQLSHAFWVSSPAVIKGRDIIVVDDVITTGASVSAVAGVLKKAGAKKVVAMSFAYKKLT